MLGKYRVPRSIAELTNIIFFLWVWKIMFKILILKKVFHFISKHFLFYQFFFSSCSYCFCFLWVNLGTFQMSGFVLDGTMSIILTLNNQYDAYVHSPTYNEPGYIYSYAYFEFGVNLPAYSTYEISVKRQPDGMTCIVCSHIVLSLSEIA